MRCDQVQERLTETALSHGAERPADRAHAEQCPACAAHARFLRELARELDGLSVPELSAVALAASRERALRTLREQRARSGFGRDLVRALGLALIALPVALAHAWLVVRGAAALLGGILPEPLLVWLGLVYCGSLALTLGILYGSIPLAVALARRPRPELA